MHYKIVCQLSVEFPQVVFISLNLLRIVILFLYFYFLKNSYFKSDNSNI